MNDPGRLQKAVEITLGAGYQMDKEAFDFLSGIALKDDPMHFMNKAIQEIERLNEKPLFIEKSFLEILLKHSERCEEAGDQVSEIAEKSEMPIENILPCITQDLNRPYAKDVESRISIIEDCTDKISSNGTLEEFLHYFQERFKKIQKKIRQRMDVKAATPISEALKSPVKTKLKIIGMVTEKRDVKHQLLITIEDLNATATVLVPSKASEDVQKKAQLLLPDQVICLAVIKTRGDFFLAEDIIFPEIGQRQHHRASEPIYAVLTSDMHVGSNKFNREAFKRFILWLNGQYGNEEMREIAGHVKYLLVAGDIVDGVGVFPGQARELNIRDVHKQYKLAAKIFSRIPEYIEIIVSPGNHDASRKALPQPAISEDYLCTTGRSRKIYSVGNPCMVSLHGVEVLMYHGRSLDDIIGAVPGTEHSHPEKAMKLLLQCRHLAPIYGGKTTLSSENNDFLVIEKVPDIFHAGHIHVLGVCNHRGVLVINSGGWQEQTDYMAKLGLIPTPGKVPVVNLQTLETTILSFI